MRAARIHVSEPLTDALCERFIEWAASAGEAHVALSGGRTPRAFFDLIATKHRDRIPWERISLYQVDERCVPPDREDSNWKQIHERVLARVPELRGYRMRAESDEAAEEYEELLRGRLPQDDAGMPVFDLIVLGLGPDGHTASLFPGTEALEETRRAVVRHWVESIGAWRVTLTLPVLNAAGGRWFMLRGAEHRGVFDEVQEGQHPAGQVRDAEWFVEPALERGPYSRRSRA